MLGVVRGLGARCAWRFEDGLDYGRGETDTFGWRTVSDGGHTTSVVPFPLKHGG